MADPRKARGWRNKNPGNIRKTGEWKNWQGIAPDIEQTDKEFVVFKTHAFGIRALARTLITYRDKYHLTTIAGIIGRWAPPNENDTGAYARAVAKYTGIGVRDYIDVAEYGVAVRLIPAIINHELGGMPYTREQIDEGLRLAGISRPSRRIRGYAPAPSRARAPRRSSSPKPSRSGANSKAPAKPMSQPPLRSAVA
jgi:hypothetical protein